MEVCVVIICVIILKLAAELPVAGEKFILE